jgi:hypothetical protein
MSNTINSLKMDNLIVISGIGEATKDGSNKLTLK